MEIRNKKITIPFYCVGWYRQDVLVHTYYDVKFYEDFGSFVRNEKFSSIITFSSDFFS